MIIDRLLPQFDLQLFADGAAAADAGDAGGQGATDNGKGATGADSDKPSADDAKGASGKDKTFTQEDIDKIIGQRLAAAQSKWEKDLATKVAEAKTEAEKLAKMNADQKAQYEREKQETELTKRESEITRRELRATALETLAEKGLPKQLADLLNYADADSTNKSIEAAETAFRAAVEAGVNERLKGDTPKGGGAKGNATHDEIAKIFARR